ncbi:recombinase family protein [Dactylosporangium sp. CA-152071]|uniref:recombinase family protein n=1 Tax=Dactylosporangium sp. CA-152071 TaxID=3239933 RepID=UPI003D8B96B4
MPRRIVAAVPDRPSRVVAYVRVSSLMGRGGDDFHSPEVQLSAMRRATAGMQEVDVVDDIDESGTDFNREGIDKIRAMAQARQIDAIAVYDVSRFGRNVLESLLVLQELAGFGVTIISASEHIDTSTPAGEMMLINMLNLAQYRAKEIGRGWSNTINQRAQKGLHHGRPLGYTRVNKRMVPDPVVGPAMSEAFRRYARGEEISAIAGYLAAVRGRPVHTSNLKKAFRSLVYRGHVIEAGLVLPGLHEPLVDEDTWQSVQDRLAVETGAPPRHLAPTWSLVGLCECPKEHKLQRQPAKGRDGIYVDRLVCGMARSGVKGSTCAGVGRPLLDLVEEEVLSQVASYAARLRSDHHARAARLARLAAASADRDSLSRSLKTLRTGMAKLATEWALSQIPEQTYRDALSEMQTAEGTVLAELARLGPAKPDQDPAVTAKAAEALLALWPRMTYAERGKALRSVVDRIVVRAAERWREPEEDRVEVLFRW